jgi:hypothetical protein
MSIPCISSSMVNTQKLMSMGPRKDSAVNYILYNGEGCGKVRFKLCWLLMTTFSSCSQDPSSRGGAVNRCLIN